jgi:hypothetical protein
MFFITLITMCSSITGRDHFQAGLSEVGKVLDNAATVFETVELDSKRFSSSATKFSAVAKKALVTSPLPPPRLCNCDDDPEPSVRARSNGEGCSDTAIGEALDKAAGNFKDASDALEDLVGGLGGKLTKMKKQLTEDGPKLLDALILATVALFFPWALAGLIGVGMGRKCPRMSDCFLNGAAFLGLLIMLILAIMITVELAVGVVFADFCFSDPLTAMVSLVNENMDGENAKLMTFYLDCAAGKGNDFGPVNGKLIQVQEFAGLLSEIAQGAGEDYACNDATMKGIYAPSGAAAIAINATSGMMESLSCQSINPLLVDLTHTAICDKTMSGISSLFISQVLAAVFMIVTLHFASFTRPYMNVLEPGDKMIKDKTEASSASETTNPMETNDGASAGAIEVVVQSDTQVI